MLSLNRGLAKNIILFLALGDRSLSGWLGARCKPESKLEHLKGTPVNHRRSRVRSPRTLLDSSSLISGNLDSPSTKAEVMSELLRRCTRRSL
jgi:hypothetical protein